jgi:hexosaminidase
MRQLLLLSFSASLVAAIWPIPVTYEHGDTVLFVKRDVPFYWYEAGVRNVGSMVDQAPFIFSSNSNTNSDPQDISTLKLRKRYTEPSLSDDAVTGSQEGVSGDKIIEFAINSTWNTIFKQNLYPWKFHPRNWSEPSPSGGNTTYVSRINIKVLSTDPPNIAKPLAGEVDESYRLTLTEEGLATISANTSVGVARGLTTLTQLFYAHSDKKLVYTSLAPVTIFDSPKFQHRGINLDVSRNYFAVSDVKRQIDACAYNKMNRFHLHVTDSQSWPLEVPSMPELSAKGAYRPDLVYTADDFRSMQRHAALQGIEMITEIDMPGHTSSIYYSYPSLIAAFNKQPDWDTYAAEPPSGTLKLNSTAVYDFLEKLLDDLLPRVLPYSSYFHTGGDEVNKNAYLFDDTVTSNDSAILQPLMQKFVDRNHDQVRAMGLTPVVWEEMLLEWNVTLGPDVIVQSWQSDEAVAQIVAKGHKVLVGNYNYWVRFSLPKRRLQGERVRMKNERIC